MGNVVIANQMYYPFMDPVSVEQEFDLTGSSSYATGGDSIVAADIQAKLMPAINNLVLVQFFLVEPRSDGFTIALIKATAKVLIRDNTGAEVANLSNQSTRTWRCRIRYYDNSPFFGA